MTRYKYKQCKQCRYAVPHSDSEKSQLDIFTGAGRESIFGNFSFLYLQLQNKKKVGVGGLCVDGCCGVGLPVGEGVDWDGGAVCSGFLGC